MSKKKRAKKPLAPALAKVETPPGRKLGAVLVFIEPLSVAAVYVYFLAHTWLRWMDPLIDFPKELYLAWRISEGDLLYQKVTNWYGPLAELVQAAGFRLFGVGVDTLVWMNIALTTVVILLLRAVFGTLGTRFSQWLCCLAFLGVFAFGHYGLVANANFIGPYMAQATYGFAGLLLVLWGGLRHLKSGRPLWLGVAGIGLAVTYLDKPEPLLAAGGSLAVYFMAGFIRVARQNPLVVAGRGAARWAAHTAGWLAGGFFCLWLPVFLFFLCMGGLRYALLATDYVPHTVLNGSFRAIVEHSQFMQTMFGFDRPGNNFLHQLKQGVLLLLVMGVMVVATRRWARAPRLSVTWWVSPPVVAGLAGVAFMLARRSNYWTEIGGAFVFPVCFAAGGAAWMSLRAAWNNRADASAFLAQAVVGVAAALMMARMILYGRFSQFGFFMMPLAVLWTIHLLVVEAARPQPSEVRKNWLQPAAVALVTLVGAFILGRFNLSAYAQKNYAVGSGRDQFYTFSPESYPSGWLLNTMVSAFKEQAPGAKTLVAFPEGIAVNYLLRVPSPLAELEFHPVALGYAGPQHVLDELQAHPPDAVFLFHRDLSEFGVNYFGQDEASGRGILVWLNEHYRLAWSAGSSPNTLTGHAIDLLLPKTTEQPGPAVLPAETK